MARAYDIDLRVKVFKALDSGIGPSELSRRFFIDLKTIYLWRKQRDSRGHIKPIKSYQKGHSHKIKDLVKFKEFVEANSSLTTSAMAKKLGNVSQRTVCRMLHKLNFSRKKRVMAILTGMKRSVSHLEKKLSLFPKRTVYIWMNQG